MTNCKIQPQRLCILLLLLFCVLTSFDGFAQMNITGQIISKDDNQPLPGATVLLKGTTKGTLTGIDGKFSLSVNSEKDVLVFSMIGYASQEITVGTQLVINVSLETQVTGLEEVVVIGYGVVKKSDLTGSVSGVKTKELTAIPTTNALEALQGKVAGLDLTKNSGQPGASLNLTVRGNRSINAQNKPLIIVGAILFITLLVFLLGTF